MKAAGITVEKSELEVFFKALGEKGAHELIKDGKAKLIVMPCGGGGGGGPAAAAGPSAAEPTEEKKEEVETVDMGGLFGDDDDGY